MTIIPKGALFLVTSGEFGDYGVLGLFRALRNIEEPEMKSVEELIARGYCESLPYYELFVGSHLFPLEITGPTKWGK